MRCSIFISTVIFVLLCCTMLTASAQCPGAFDLNITATLYTQENGLASNMLAGIAKDSTGYRYFLGIDGKWVRYDGVNFSTKRYDRFAFVHGRLKSFACDGYSEELSGNTRYKFGNDKNGVPCKWGISGDKLIWLNIRDNKSDSFLFPKLLTEVEIPGFFPDGEVCWVTSSTQVFRFDIKSKKFLHITLPAFTAAEPTRDVLFIFFNADGNTYLPLNNLVLKLNNSATSFDKFSSFSRDPFTSQVREIIMDNYLFTSDSHFLYEVALDNGVVRKLDLLNYTTNKSSFALKITSLVNYNNYLLIGTSNAGLFIFNRCTNSMQHFQYAKQSDGADLTNAVVWVSADTENVVWMQTEAGLIKLEVNDQQIKTYLPSSVKNDGLCNSCNNVRAIYPLDSNHLLIGSLGGICSFDLNTGKFNNLASPVDNKPVWKDRSISAITGDGTGNIFISDWGNTGILLLNKEKKELVNILEANANSNFSFSFLQCLFYDSHKVLWAGTREGIIRISNLDEFEKNGFKGKLDVSNYFPGITNHSLRPLSCFAISEDRNGNIWMGGTNGLFVFNYSNNTITRYTHIEGNKSSLSDNEVRSIYISGNDVWIGTNTGGLNHFDPVTKTFTAFTIENGLPNNSIYNILADKNGFLWLGTNAGLCRFNKTDYSVRNYTPRDGIQNFEFNTNAMATTADGRFCFGGRTGFNIFHPDSINTPLRSTTPVVITRCRIFDREIPVSKSVIELPHDENSFTFDFAALSYYRSSDNRYSYQLEGADKDWIKSGNRQFTSYSNLPPGNYTFKVRAANYTGTSNKEEASMQFIIHPAWHNTWWFRLLLALLFAGGIYGLYRYRLQQIITLQDVRNRIASDLHDEIGSTLSSISLSSTIIQNKLNGTNPEVRHLLQQVSNNTDSMMEALSDIVWAINTRNDRFDNVVNRMRAFAIEVLEPHGIGIQFHVSVDLLNIQLDMQQRKNLYLIFKEAINNIVKYAGCKEVSIDIRQQGSKTFVLDIKDDGNGFDIAQKTGEKTLSGNGIRNMKKRAEELGGEMTIVSSAEIGTTLHLWFTI